MSGMVSSSWPWSQRRLCGPAACLCEDVDVVCVKRLFFCFCFCFSLSKLLFAFSLWRLDLEVFNSGGSGPGLLGG